MSYTIKEAAQITHLPATTLRYYDKEGILPMVERKESGYRIFSDKDITMIRLVECLKKTGLSIKDIKQFSKWVSDGDASLQQRYQLFLDRKECVQQQIQELQETLELINYKCQYYETAIAAGTEAIHKQQKP